MQPRRLRCKIRAANFLTREPKILVPFSQLLLLPGRGFEYSRRGSVPITLRARAKSLLGAVQLFDEGHAVNLVQGRNPAENLLQSRLSQAG